MPDISGLLQTEFHCILLFNKCTLSIRPCYNLHLFYVQEYWLLLHNVSYCVPLLEKLPFLLMTASGKLSEETTFRLWISSPADKCLPTRLLHCCTKIVIDSPMVSVYILLQQQFHYKLYKILTYSEANSWERYLFMIK